MKSAHTKTWLSLGMLLLTGCSGQIFQPGTATVQLLLPVYRAPAVQAPVQTQGLALPGEYIVTFKSRSLMRQVAADGGDLSLQMASEGTRALVRASSMQEVLQLPGVLQAQPNYQYMPLALPNDPYLNTPFDPSLPDSRQWWLQQIGAPTAWDETETFTPVKVAVLDDGYANHEDLPVDRLDLKTVGCNTTTGALCLNPADRNDDARYPDEDIISHGMQVAGVVGAATNNALGVASLSWNAKNQSPLQVMPINIYDKKDGSSSTQIISQAIHTAILKGAKVINLSLCMTDGAGCSQTNSDPVLDEALIAAKAAGVVVVASAGNYNKSFVGYPANSVNVVGVGATNLHKERAYFSNYGARLRMVAPGQDLLLLQAKKVPEGQVQTGYALNSGTSFSSPMVAAAAGLLFSKRPAATWDQVVGALIHSGEELDDPSLKEARFLRVDRALQEIGGDVPPPPPLADGLSARVTIFKAESGMQIPGAAGASSAGAVLYMNNVVFDFYAGQQRGNILSNQKLDAGTYTGHSQIV